MNDKDLELLVNLGLKKQEEGGRYLVYDLRPMMKFKSSINRLKDYVKVNVPDTNLTDNMLILSIIINPRMLYDFFDTQGIYCGVINDEGPTFSGFVNDTLVDNSTNRHKVEESIFNKAFEVLDGKS